MIPTCKQRATACQCEASEKPSPRRPWRPRAAAGSRWQAMAAVGSRGQIRADSGRFGQIWAASGAKRDPLNTVLAPPNNVEGSALCRQP